MADVKKSIECDYCGVSFHIKYDEDDLHGRRQPIFCIACGEYFDNPDKQISDEDDDDDDYADDREDSEAF
jgi:hypothetical protein